MIAMNENSKKHTVLVTGANGFIGNNVCKSLLDAGWTVIGMGLKSPNAVPDSRLVMEYVNITDTEEVKSVFTKYPEIDSVIHLAAIVHGKSDDLSWNAFLSVNYQASENLFKLCAEHGIRNILFSSTIKVYGDELKGKLTENSPCLPGTFYSKTKLMAEESLGKIADAAGISYGIMRFAPVYADEFRLNLVKRIYLIPGKLGYFFGKGDYRFHFCSVYNICEFAVGFLNSESSKSGIYNIADKKTYRAIDLLEFDNAKKRSRIKRVKLPYHFVIGAVFFYERLYRLLKGHETTISVGSFRELVANTEYDITRAESVCSLKWTLENTLSWITPEN
jgi:UDP-glucose 4-epimerase